MCDISVQLPLGVIKPLLHVTQKFARHRDGARHAREHRARWWRCALRFTSQAAAALPGCHSHGPFSPALPSGWAVGGRDGAEKN